MKTTSRLVLGLTLFVLLATVGAALAEAPGSGLESGRALTPGKSPILSLVAGPEEDGATCVADEETLCLLDGQVGIRVRFRNQRSDQQEGTGKAALLGNRTGTFWFFRPDNVEIVVKALDGRRRNGHFWIFLGSLSDLEFWVEATAAASGVTTTYYNPPGHLYGLADTRALGSDEGAVCGTFQGLACSEGFFCELTDGCNVADGAGTCLQIPEICTAEFIPVCGCDGTTYSNDCLRQMAQAQKDHDGACGDQGPSGDP